MIVQSRSLGCSQSYSMSGWNNRSTIWTAEWTCSLTIVESITIIRETSKSVASCDGYHVTRQTSHSYTNGWESLRSRSPRLSIFLQTLGCSVHTFRLSHPLIGDIPFEDLDRVDDNIAALTSQQPSGQSKIRWWWWRSRATMLTF